MAKRRKTPRLTMYDTVDFYKVKPVKKSHHSIIIYEYSDEDGEGNRIWIRYDPKSYSPDSDTRARSI